MSNKIVFFFQAEDGIRDIGVTGVQTCALPILRSASGGATERSPCPRSRLSGGRCRSRGQRPAAVDAGEAESEQPAEVDRGGAQVQPGVVLGHAPVDRKSTRLNSSHANISYAVFCLKKKTISSCAKV